MTRDEILVDLYTRLTSRKLWFALATIVLAIIGYRVGELTYWQMQTAVTGAFGVYAVAEGAADALRAHRGHRTAPEAIASVNVDTQPKPAPKRVRPSRAKKKAA